MKNIHWMVRIEVRETRWSRKWQDQVDLTVMNKTSVLEPSGPWQGEHIIQVRWYHSRKTWQTCPKDRDPIHLEKHSWRMSLYPWGTFRMYRTILFRPEIVNKSYRWVFQYDYRYYLGVQPPSTFCCLSYY